MFDYYYTRLCGLVEFVFFWVGWGLVDFVVVSYLFGKLTWIGVLVLHDF